MTTNTEDIKPFSIGYVMKTTVKHIRKDLNISIDKTFARIKDFSGNQEKSEEVFETLALLHSLRKQVDDFQFQNKEKFKD